MFTRLIAVFALAATPLLAQQNDAVLKRVDDHYNHLSSLQAHYSEHYAGLGMDRTESGTLLLKKPGRMRWNYASPAGKVFILDGKNGWFYTPGDPQAQRVSAKQLDDLRSPLRFLLGHTQLNKELTNIQVQAAPGGFRISGIPKGMGERIKNLTLGIDEKGLILSMSLEELDGATTIFTFSDLHENIPTRDADFTFTPPAGVTVVDGLPPI
jgi:outer membrane lipoprotein carrier protein